MFETIKNFFSSGGINLYVTVGLVALLVILAIIYFMKKSIWFAAKNRLAKALESKGLPVQDMKEDKPRLFSRFSGGIPSGKDVKKMGNKLRAILDKEKELKQKERILTKEIENLYMETSELRKDDRPTKQKQAKGEVLGEDVKKVLKMTDDLLAKLSDDAISEFSKSKDFELYKKVMKKVK